MWCASAASRTERHRRLDSRSFDIGAIACGKRCSISARVAALSARPDALTQVEEARGELAALDIDFAIEESFLV